MFLANLYPPPPPPTKEKFLRTINYKDPELGSKQFEHAMFCSEWWSIVGLRRKIPFTNFFLTVRNGVIRPSVNHSETVIFIRFSAGHLIVSEEQDELTTGIVPVEGLDPNPERSVHFFHSRVMNSHHLNPFQLGFRLELLERHQLRHLILVRIHDMSESDVNLLGRVFHGNNSPVGGLSQVQIQRSRSDQSVLVLEGEKVLLEVNYLQYCASVTTFDGCSSSPPRI